MLNIRYALLITITLKLRQNWRQEATHLPAPAKRAAFTLIELSIVLVIIGLLAGGVLVGKDMIRAAEWRSFHARLTQYETAVNAFKIKYGQLPGDFSKASMFWGTYCQQSGVANTNCNGNNNKIINGFFIPTSHAHWGGVYASNFGHEFAMFWRHLWLADLLDQETNGFQSPGGLRNSGYAGINIPKAEFDSGIYAIGKGFFVGYYDPSRYPTTGASWGAQDYISGATGWVQQANWTKEELIKFDEKFDDGLAGTGQIRGTQPYGGGIACVGGSQEYNSKNCILTYQILK